jgi:hypothetical protein
MEFDSICKENRNNFDDDTTVQIVQIAQDCHFYFKEAQHMYELNMNGHVFVSWLARSTYEHLPSYQFLHEVELIAELPLDHR